ncbi:sensor histidine kinase [Eisenbergiella sp.]
MSYLQRSLLYFYSSEAFLSQTHMMAVFCLLGTAAFIASNFNGMYYYFDENSVYCIGPLSWVNLILWNGLFLASSLIVLFHRKLLGWRETCILISFGVLPVLTSPLDAIWDITPRYIAITLSILMVYMVIHVTQSKRLLEKELELSDSRVRLLLGQIQPHFIFNSLQAIEELCFEDPEQAGKTVHDFSKYLRGNLDAMSCNHLIPFEQELEHIHHYLAIEQADPESRLQVVYHLDTTDFYVPPLCVQPIVENAVRHGIGTQSKGGTVTISAWEEKEAFIIRVADDGTGFTSATEKQNERQRVGLQNVRTRLDAQCGGTLHISTSENGTSVTIYIPKGAHK